MSSILTDVESMIQALASERDAITRAIASLQPLMAKETPRTAITQTADAKQEHRRRRPRQRIKASVKRAIVKAMEARNGMSTRDAVQRLSAKYGVKPSTLATSWAKWAHRA